MKGLYVARVKASYPRTEEVTDMLVFHIDPPALPTSRMDSDGDGWTDNEESKAGPNIYNKDTDGDGWWDPKDPNPFDPAIPEKGGELLQSIVDLLRDMPNRKFS